MRRLASTLITATTTAAVLVAGPGAHAATHHIGTRSADVQRTATGPDINAVPLLEDCARQLAAAPGPVALTSAHTGPGFAYTVQTPASRTGAPAFSSNVSVGAVTVQARVGDVDVSGSCLVTSTEIDNAYNDADPAAALPDTLNLTVSVTPSGPAGAAAPVTFATSDLLGADWRKRATAGTDWTSSAAVPLARAATALDWTLNYTQAGYYEQAVTAGDTIAADPHQLAADLTTAVSAADAKLADQVRAHLAVNTAERDAAEAAYNAQLAREMPRAQLALTQAMRAHTDAKLLLPKAQDAEAAAVREVTNTANALAVAAQAAHDTDYAHGAAVAAAAGHKAATTAWKKARKARKAATRKVSWAKANIRTLKKAGAGRSATAIADRKLKSSRKALAKAKVQAVAAADALTKAEKARGALPAAAAAVKTAAAELAAATTKNTDAQATLARAKSDVTAAQEALTAAAARVEEAQVTLSIVPEVAAGARDAAIKAADLAFRNRVAGAHNVRNQEVADAQARHDLAAPVRVASTGVASVHTTWTATRSGTS